MAFSCQRCGKTAATVHVTDLLQNENRERHLCSDCAEEEGVVMKSNQLQDVLNKFVAHKANVQELVDLACEHCGMTFVEFRSHGLLGCPHDYDAFKKALEPLIERFHEGAVQHIGKVAARVSDTIQKRQELLRLHRELQQAVEVEQYEDAARLRDEIRKLETS